tara:strand:+ start:979 stop:2169 length:1191 start_codon:yes stop_codon:yes gene_type:complete
MAKFKKSFLNPVHRKEYTTPESYFKYIVNGFTESYYEAGFTDPSTEPFPAVVVSGYRTNDNTGTGQDFIDAQIVTLNDGRKYLEVTVVPLIPIGDIHLDIPSMKDPEMITNAIKLYGSVFRARSEFAVDKSKIALHFGQEIMCYCGKGSIASSDWEDLRFIKPTNSDINPLYKDIYGASQDKGPIKTFEKAQSSLLGAYDGAGAQVGPGPDKDGSAARYDSDKTIPLKTQHAPFIADANPTMVPYIKAFIYECWNQKKIKIQLNSTFRSAAGQQALYDKWVAGGKQGVKPATPGTSWHNIGCSFDFNPYLADGTQLGVAQDRSTWINSGIPEIGKSLNLRWGGNFGSNYDPIHFDISSQRTAKGGASPGKFSNSKKIALYNKSVSDNVPANKIPLI